jgi:hypothetical protein
MNEVVFEVSLGIRAIRLGFHRIAIYYMELYRDLI